MFRLITATFLIGLVVAFVTGNLGWSVVLGLMAVVTLICGGITRNPPHEDDSYAAYKARADMVR